MRHHTNRPKPRRRINPALHRACRASGLPLWRLAIVAGITHQSRLSALICAETVPATRNNIAHLHRIADAIGFPKPKLFLQDETEVVL